MLTKRQKQFLDFITQFSQKHGFAPSFAEMKKRFKLRSLSTIHQHISALEQKGYINREKGRARSVVASRAEKMVQVPLLGRIAAGQPIEAIEDKETIAVPQSKLPFSSGNYYALRVAGDSMKDERINDGDIVLVKEQKTAENGQKVVALVNNSEATLKTFYKERGRVRLEPANKNYAPIFVGKDTPIAIQGVVCEVIKTESTSPSFSFSTPPTSLQTQKKCAPSDAIVRDNKTLYEFYLGDSLQVLPRLTRKYTTIYLDPPFNSNRHYSYSASEEKFGFRDQWNKGEYEFWLDAMLGACKERLTQDGTLFFHISAELSLTPHLILQKHFKKVEPIFWKKAHGKNTVKNKLGAVVDIIFKASNNGSKFNLLHVPLDEYYFENSYRNKDEVGLYALGSLKHDKTRRGYFYKIERGGLVYEAPYGWKVTREKLELLLRQNRIHFAKPKPGTNRAMLYKKLYKHETKGKPLSNLWDDIAYITRTTKDERLYPTQKPFELLKRLIQLSSNANDWVLDPVAGSGTTGAAALALNRHVTLIDNSKDAERIIRKRMRNTQLAIKNSPTLLNLSVYEKTTLSPFAPHAQHSIAH